MRWLCSVLCSQRQRLDVLLCVAESFLGAVGTTSVCPKAPTSRSLRTELAQNKAPATASVLQAASQYTTHQTYPSRHDDDEARTHTAVDPLEPRATHTSPSA